MNHRDVSAIVTRWVVRRAARHAPPTLVQRLEEEWLADLASRQAGWSRVRLALGCAWAAHVIASEYLNPWRDPQGLRALARRRTRPHTAHKTTGPFKTEQYEARRRRAAAMHAGRSNATMAPRAASCERQHNE